MICRRNQIRCAKKAMCLFWHRLRFLLALIVAWGFFHTASLRAADLPVLPEAQVKAAFLINFPKYMDWPAEAFAETNSPVVIAVLGESKVADELQKAIVGRTVAGREIVLKRLASGQTPVDCHILFISASEKNASAVLFGLKHNAILTVGETADFLDHGGIINLARRDRKIALDVDLIAASDARIKISSKLLSVANVVKGGTN